MASNTGEIERLRREIKKANREIKELEANYGHRLTREVAEIRQQFAESMANQQADLSHRFQELEQSMCSAYLQEVERMRKEYTALVAQVECYETQLEEQIQRMTRQQEEFFAKRMQDEQKLEALAQHNMELLHQAVLHACEYPVDLFFPHAIQRYIDAGEEAQQLIKHRLYSLAVAKADAAYMAVERLQADTAMKVKELDLMFDIYREKIEAIRKVISCDTSRQLVDEDGNVILELSETDVDYWSDLLYSELCQALEEHEKTIQAGTQGWLERYGGAGVSPTLSLDKEIQKLDLIPQRLGICISYALSACDCYNYTFNVLDRATELLTQQNFAFSGLAFGPCKEGNDNSNGYQFYTDHFLLHEMCFQTGKKPDYREERRLTFTKTYVGKARPDVCHIYLVPRRNLDTVAVELFLSLETDYLPEVVQEKILQLFQKQGIAIHPIEAGGCVATLPDRPLNLVAMERFHGFTKEKEISAKYSLNT